MNPELIDTVKAIHMQLYVIATLLGCILGALFAGR